MPKTDRWYALTVRPRSEKAVAGLLSFKGFEGYVPVHRERHRWSDRLRDLELPLFPGYVFGRFPFSQRAGVLGIPSVTSVVCFGGYPHVLENREIEAIQRMIASGLPIRTWPFLEVGQRVRICGGCMDGVEGVLVREKPGFRVVVNVEVLHRALSVEIERDRVKATFRTSSGRQCNLHLT